MFGCGDSVTYPDETTPKSYTGSDLPRTTKNGDLPVQDSTSWTSVDTTGLRTLDSPSDRGDVHRLDPRCSLRDDKV